MDDADKVIEAFEKWFEADEGLQPHPREYAKNKRKEEEAFQKDLLQQLNSWEWQNFPGWEAIEATKPKSWRLFGYPFTADVELVHANGQCVPIEVELMKDGAGWKPAEAVGQAIMFSRRSDAGKAIAAILDVRSNPSAEGETERKLKADLWEKFGVRLCVRRGGE